MEAELSILFDDVRILQMGRMFQLAATFVVLYDHVLCCQQEVDLIWNRSKSLVSYLYFTAFDAVTPAHRPATGGMLSQLQYVRLHLFGLGRILFHFQSYGPFVPVWATQTIMQLRIYAMYRKSNKILAFTGVFFVLEIAAICTVLALNFDHALTYTNEAIPGLLNMCATSTINRSFTAIYVPIFCFELLLFVLAIFVVLKHMKNTRTIAGKRLHNTMATLVKYNTIYFFVEMAGCGIATTLYLGLPVMWFLTIHPSGHLSYSIQSIYLEITNSVLIATTIILGSRLVLGTRNFYSDPSVEDGSDLSHGTSLSPTFTQPSSFGSLSSHIEMSMIGGKGHHLDTSDDAV
ncbi:uncharacterized protein F5891DRAFT_1257483 [Suillus fuscotomentosus]|uniref:DUF6533 domain-containing protein n=1 Tax=Suillus fuscotomentosus TaxID=1912939 RepID=A0AAD4EEM1_9AGAM|nr:uncharacterized protein F5891DRAFT_1257483 [Suillus fuscotomentosus]KAG1904637.1 hypothetical protein F5891DRAFT_1257483 [Suillus fuscotomentosus]